MSDIQWTPVIGLAFGIILGVVASFGGWGPFLIVLVLGVAGFLIGRIAESGEVNLSGLSMRRK
ncbi:hypothetical protein FH608_020760 [Nonomuraea phyllanthi]|uniref:Uncharacterized protein n=1 Tax=Nonomuraea phyllanthi TaxID=2219224 RepID=A0A5C4WHE5_9ACTN|nr:hypothetical protein [Nonomuraea phyllanthi]KAB8193649.1 hypothetical protein FH608_020760 [Nonomuraea phyllanthi]QFY12390.1 hypothetical protein GBF35_42665 [Nonomuraea phyllanthi]